LQVLLIAGRGVMLLGQLLVANSKDETIAQHAFEQAGNVFITEER
jgi:hypothetical protein